MAILGLQGVRGGTGVTSITAALAWALQLLGETVLAIDSEEINEALKEKVRAMAETGTITKTNDEGGYEFYYGEKYEYRRVPLAKSFVYSVLRIVILPIRHLL